ncbi:MAG: S8 family serine peptidase [Pyrinomonadaceae bacterium]
MSSKTVIFQSKEEISPTKVLSNTISTHSSSEKLLNAIPENAFMIEKVFDIAEEAEPFEAALSQKLEDTDAMRELSDLKKRMNRTYKINCPNSEVAEFVYKILESSQAIEFVQYDNPNELASNDEFVNWGVGKIGCESIWDISKGNGVIVAVIDSGVFYEHPDIRLNMWKDPLDGTHGRDFANPNTDPDDASTHGTHCAGIIAAIANNGIGIAGVAPEAQIMALKVFPNNASLPVEDSFCANAMIYAADKGAKVLNNSWAPAKALKCNKTLQMGIDYAYLKGCIVIVAAGNSKNGQDVKKYFPANYKRVITVAATTEFDNRWVDSNYGDEVDVAAPGEDIISLLSDGTSGPLIGGTSMACAHVSGLAALLVGVSLKAGKSLSFEKIKDYICNKIYVEPVVRDVDKRIGSGRINAAKSVRAAAQELNLLDFDNENSNLEVISKKLNSELNESNGYREYTQIFKTEVVTEITTKIRMFAKDKE